MNEQEAFDQLAGNMTAPMIIVTTRAGDEINGCLVGFSTQCSIDPPRYLVCLSKANRTYEVACDATSLVVHVLHDSAHDLALARHFGELTAHETEKLDQISWAPGPDDIPVLTDCDWFAGTIIEKLDLGDHVGFVLAVSVGSAARAAEPFLGIADVHHLDAGNPA